MSTTPASSNLVNLARHLPPFAEATPYRRAIVVPTGRDRQGRVAYTHLTFAQLTAEIDRLAAGMQAAGIQRGMRVVLMVRPGLDFLPLIYALFKTGAVPVLIDPGMGRQNLFRCIEQVRPEAFIGIPLAHLARVAKPQYFTSVRIAITIGKRWGWGGYDMNDLRTMGDGIRTPIAVTRADEPAAIIFTTGSTGPPKGVEYTHGMFEAQRRLLGDTFGLTPDDVDLPGFALFAMFTIALGCTVVLPDMDPTRPATVDPRRIVEAIDNHGATFSFGSPALWHTVSRYCLEHGIRFPSLRGVTMAGAPIPGWLHARMLGHVLPEGARVYTPYGATECLPVTSFTGAEVLAETLPKTAAGGGVCVGPPLPGVKLKVIRLSDRPIRRWAEAEELPANEIGEVVVQGPMVSRRYFGLPEQTDLHKIYETDDLEKGPFWHRIGDCGYVDEAGRFWFCGRKAHRVVTGERTLFTLCVEARFNQHHRVYRSALVGLGGDRYDQLPVLIVEPEAGEFPATPEAKELFRLELAEISSTDPRTADIRHYLFHPSFPVDIRHNAKIFREQLARWAVTVWERETGS